MVKYSLYEHKWFVGLAQLDRAFGYGPKGRGFESSNPRNNVPRFARDVFSDKGVNG